METTFQSINPVTQVLLRTYQPEDQTAIMEKVEKAAARFKTWRKVALEEGRVLFLKMADLLRKTQRENASLITEEMGKPIRQAWAEVEKCAWLCEYYAQNATTFLSPQVVKREDALNKVIYQALGVILEIMPWNFPFWQVFRCAVPAILAGNTVLLKHAPNVSTCALRIQEIFEQVGFEQGVFQCILAQVNQIPSIVAHEAVQGVALTGSLGAGKVVGALAGQNIKKCILELGGSDPIVILEDADLKKASKAAVQSKMYNSGQTCIAAKRFIVQKSIAKEFLSLVKAEIARLHIGDPMDLRTDLSAMARPDLVEQLQNQLEDSVKMGATTVLEGGRAGSSNYFEPVILSNLSKGMPAYDDELFGPLIAFFEVDSIQEAIHLANDSNFGLGASVWTSDSQKAEKLALEIETGNLAINQILRSDPRMPFGGIKQSGFGRELGREGILTFVNIKSIFQST